MYTQSFTKCGSQIQIFLIPILEPRLGNMSVFTANKQANQAS